MGRSRTTKNLFERQPAKIVKLINPILREAIGEAEQKGCWLIYGPDKNGKTTLTLMIAQDLAKGEKVGYVSAEEGLDKSFTDACRRAGVNAEDKILWHEYMNVKEIIEQFSKPKSPRIIIIDNLTMYQDEMTPGELKKTLIDGLPNKLLILLAHEERRLPYPALGRMASKIAKVIFHVQGLRASVVSRFGPGGVITIDEERSELYWGEERPKI
jgi:Predicted ATP-dependent serine protease